MEGRKGRRRGRGCQPGMDGEDYDEDYYEEMMEMRGGFGMFGRGRAMPDPLPQLKHPKITID